MDQLGLLGAGLALHDAVVDVGLADPAAHRLDRDVEVVSNLSVVRVTPAGDPHHVTLGPGPVLCRADEP